ncbi:hypothetical protein B0H94_10893 [Salsuginibacillus halophilus]|uniref:Uncharacterized protein n=1 Tax=Salsuginibacillus halophilus TaxID=517424 RepID=A0A2P8HE49_9BACI|nr:hypothetical protein [Salsuginibacillus halophilus]PSL44482.1 hypothetical protein B0H94_10893 [Salsuginibacillus halophilus]
MISGGVVLLIFLAATACYIFADAEPSNLTDFEGESENWHVHFSYGHGDAQNTSSNEMPYTITLSYTGDADIEPEQLVYLPDHYGSEETLELSKEETVSTGVAREPLLRGHGCIL